MSNERPGIRSHPRSHDERDWSGWTSEAKAIADTIRMSGYLDKELAETLAIDNATLSRVQNGQARLSEQHMDALMDACGDEAWLQYWLLKRGYDPRCLRRIESDLERENRLLREQLARVESEREVELRLLSRIRTAA